MRQRLNKTPSKSQESKLQCSMWDYHF